MNPATAGPCYVADVCLSKAWVDGIAIAEEELGVAVECKEGFGLFATHGTVLKVENKDLEEDGYIYSDVQNGDSHDWFVEGADEADQALQPSSAISYNGATTAHLSDTPIEVHRDAGQRSQVAGRLA